MFKAILDDMQNKIDTALIAFNVHQAFSECIANLAQLVKQLYGINQVALSGGVFMNRYLIETTIQKLVDNGFNVAINKEVPPNDGGLSLAMCAAE